MYKKLPSVSKPLSKDMWYIFKDLLDVSIVLSNELSEKADKDQIKWLTTEVSNAIKTAEKIIYPRKKQL